MDNYKPLQNYLDNLASSQPTPGGGSAAALSGAMGASLASMVAQLSLGKVEIALQAEIEELLQKTERLRYRFQELMQEDMAAYGKLSACFKMPRGTNEERTARSQAVQEQLVEAACVPLEMTERAAELLPYCQRIAEIGNVNVLSDVAAGASLVSSAGTSAAWMVRVNVRAMKDLERINRLEKRLHTALESIAADSQRITTIVEERV